MSKEQTALERIKDEVAKEYYKVNTYEELYKASNALPFVDSIIDIIAERYARECCQATKESMKQIVREQWSGIQSMRQSEILKLIDSIK